MLRRTQAAGDYGLAHQIFQPWLFERNPSGVQDLDFSQVWLDADNLVS
jgi:hypothetical protein